MTKYICNKCVFLHKSSYLRTASSSSCGLLVAPITSTLSSPADCTYKPKHFFFSTFRESNNKVKHNKDICISNLDNLIGKYIH